MHITFTYNPAREFDNFKAAFGSRNHTKPSPQQTAFFSRYPELTLENAIAFSTAYLNEHQIDPVAKLQEIEGLWNPIAEEYFRRADRIFGRPLPMSELTVFLTVHDRCSYNYQRGYFFIHTNTPAITKTIMHELWHWYFFANFGDRVREQYGPAITNDIKEALTVLLNEEFADLMPGVQDLGYPQHAQLRQTILEIYRQTQDIAQTIDRSLQSLS